MKNRMSCLSLQQHRSPEVVKGRGVLRCVEVYQPQVVGNDPLKRVQVQSSLEARNRRHVKTL